MKQRVLFYVSLVMLCAFTYSCGVSDGDVKKHVEKELLKVFPDNKITVEAKDQVVTLTGETANEGEKLKIESLVTSMKEVKSVVNNITVPAPEPVINPDDTLKTAVAAAFTAAGFKNIAAEVKDGEVKLTGTAKKSDLKKIMQIANEAKPKKVINELKLK